MHSNAVYLQIQERATPSTGSPLQAALRMLLMLWTVLITDEQPWTTRPDQQLNAKMGACAVEYANPHRCSECLLKALDRCFHNNRRSERTGCVIITGPTKAPVMAKSQNKTEVRPNEITQEQYHRMLGTTRLQPLVPDHPHPGDDSV